MELDLEAQKAQFLSICRDTIHRDGLEDLLSWLEKADFFAAPASTKYHGASAGGLCQHSLDVFEYAKKTLCLCPVTLNEESLCIAALFHDVCKVNFYKQALKNQKINGNWEQVPYYTVEERFPFGGHGSKSVYQVQYFMKLTQDEAVAINCHMGFSDCADSGVGRISEAFQRYPLAWVIHVADEAATYMLKR